MTLTAVLFTGGLSSRMGTDKATLQIDGQSLWLRQLGVLRELQPDAILISARKRPKWCPPEAGVILDEPPSRGPLSGLAAALNRAQSSHLLALAVDLPQITSGHLLKLRSLANHGRGVFPMSGVHFEPLCAIYPIEATAIVNDMLASGSLSLQDLAQRLLRQNLADPYPLSELERALYLNVNTPGELSGRIAGTSKNRWGRSKLSTGGLF